MNLDFYHLPPPTRDRVTACIRGQTGPVPLMRETSGGSYAGASVIGVIGLIIVGLTLKSSFGSIWGSRHTFAALFPYALGFFMLGLGIVGFLRRRALDRAMPFPAGTYLFPSALLVAPSTTLEILPLSDLVSIQPTHHYVNGGYRRTTLAFTFPGRAVTLTLYNRTFAEQQLHQLGMARQAFHRAANESDLGTLQSLDPFFEASATGWRNVGPGNVEPNRTDRTVSPWLFKGGRIGLAFAVLALPVFFVRNFVSDEVAFRRAVSENTTSAYEGYLYSPPGRHDAEVRTDKLPRTELKDARDKNTVEAIQGFLAKYPHSVVDAEAQQALKDVIHGEYEKAVAKNTVSALREYMKTYPASADDQNAKDAIHHLFQKTLADFTPQANTSDPKLVPFVAGLLAYTEAHDSKPIEVRFRHHNSPSLAAADKLLAKDDDNPLSALATVSDHFDADDAKQRETIMVKSLQTAFASVFPADVLTLALGEPLPDDAGAIKSLGAVATPTILIDYEVAWSGEVYTGEKSGRRFVGIRIPFVVSMHLAGATPSTDDNALRFKLKVEPPDEFKVSYETFSDPAYGSALDNDTGPTDSKVYDVMALRAFDQLSTKLERVFFTHIHHKTDQKDPSVPI